MAFNALFYLVVLVTLGQMVLLVKAERGSGNGVLIVTIILWPLLRRVVDAFGRRRRARVVVSARQTGGRNRRLKGLCRTGDRLRLVLLYLVEHFTDHSSSRFQCWPRSDKNCQPHVFCRSTRPRRCPMSMPAGIR